MILERPAKDEIAVLLENGASLRQAGRAGEAMACYWQALALDADRPEIWVEAGLTLDRIGRREEAVAALKGAIDRAPGSASVWMAVARLGKASEAKEAALRRATALDPDLAEAWRFLAQIIAPRDPVRALEAFTHALAGLEDDPALHRGIGEALLRLGQIEDARTALQSALDRAPTDPRTHRLLAHFHLSQNESAEGWRHLAQSRPAVKPSIIPEWDGGDPSGKTILVRTEGGLDEFLPLLGATQLLAGRGARIILQIDAAWVPLLQGFDSVAALKIDRSEESGVDCAIPLWCLPSLLGVTLPRLPLAALKPSSGKGPSLPVPLGTRLKVGLLWAAGQSAEASIGLVPLLPLTGLAGVAFYGLQTGPAAADLKKFADPALITDLSPQLCDLGDLAAAVAQLDLVITVDGPMAPLAQSLGVPVWLLLPRFPDRLQPVESEPGMRRFQQAEAGDWRLPVREVGDALEALLRDHGVAPDESDMVVNAIFPDGAGMPRFRMTAPRSFLDDPGIRYLVTRERSGVGYEYATRNFLDAHLEPCDLFIDIGAHWGIMSLQAATRWPGKVKVLAFEPSPHNVPHLRRWLADNAVADQVEIVAAFAAETPGHGHLKPQSTMGHSLIRAATGTIPVVTIDSQMQGRDTGRVLVKIDVEGHEPEVIDGMQDLIASGKVAAVIWERGREYDQPAGQARLAALRQKFELLGYSAWRFDSEDDAGSLVPFVEDGRLGNIFELRQDLQPRDSYGLPRPKAMAQPADPALDAALQARRLFAEGLAAHRAGKMNEARELYRRAAALDGTLSGPYNNLGALLRNQGSRAAATAAFQRALSLAPGDIGVMSNCGNSLREIGAFTEAENLIRRGLVERPNDAGLIYNLGVLCKDTDRPDQAIRLFERALLLSPDDPEYRWDRALALLQSGDYRRGFEAYESRWGLKRAAKRKIALKLWDGTPLAGRSIFLSDEQGFGDVLQWARFVAPLKVLGAGRIVMECQPELMRLMALLPEIDDVVPRAKATPDCDVTLPLLSLPRILGVTLDNLPASVPYLRAPQPAFRLKGDDRVKVGLVWAGKPTPRDRSIGLEKLLPLLDDSRMAAFSLQIGPRAADIARLGAELLLTDLAPQLTDFAETAAVLKQLDLLITVDTAVAHLAGALGVKTFVLLRKVSDWRWFDRRDDSPWYPTMTLFRQEEPDQWRGPLERLGIAIDRELSRLGRRCA